MQNANVFVIRGCKVLFFQFNGAKCQKHVIQRYKVPITQNKNTNTCKKQTRDGTTYILKIIVFLENNEK